MGKTDSIIRKKSRIFELLFLLCAAAFLFWRAPYGYAFDDEPYFLTLPQMLSHGQHLYVDDWNPVQNLGVLTYPVYFLLYNLYGLSGIVLRFRYVYCVVWLITLAFLAVKLRDFGWKRFPALVFIALFTPLDMMTLSYTSISLMASLGISAVLYTALENGSSSPAKAGLLIGFLSTIASLCYPYYAFLFVFGWLCAFLSAFLMKGKKKFFLSLSAAMPILPCLFALVYALWVIRSGGGFALVSENLRAMLSTLADKAVVEKSPLDMLLSYFNALRYTIRGGVFLRGMLLLTVAAFFLRKTKLRSPVMLLLSLLWLYCQLPYLLNDELPKGLRINAPVRDIFFIGIAAFILLRKKPWKLFISFYGISLLYSFVSFRSSNTGVLAICMSYSVGGIAAMIFVAMLLEELKEEQGQKKLLGTICACSAALFLVFEIGTELRVRTRYTYWDDILPRLTETISFGAEKGLRTTAERKTEYEEQITALYALLPEETERDKTFIALDCRAAVSLEADRKQGGYSTWFLNDSDVEGKLQRFYEVNGRDFPDYVFLGENTEFSMFNDSLYNSESSGKFRLLRKKA